MIHAVTRRDWRREKTPSSPLEPEDAIVHAVYFALEPVGNYIVLLAPAGAYNTAQKNLSMPLRHPADYGK
jgi:hypothetical protein